MSLVPYDPIRSLTTMRKEFDRFFHDFPFAFDHDQQHLSNIRVDIYETDHEVVATCDIPGLEKKEDVSIMIENNMLTISGSIKRNYDTKEEHMFRNERFFGRFQRTITLPSAVSDEGVKASYKNGVLEIRMPKLANSQRKRIEVDFH